MAEQSEALADTDIPLPWYRASKQSEPFTLAHLITASDPNAPPFHCTAAFPWSLDSMNTLWDGSVTDAQVLQDWNNMVHEWAGSIAVGSTGRLLVFPKLTARPLAFRLPDDKMEVPCAAWALNQNSPTDPLVVFTTSSVIYILDLKTRNIVGRLRGHGGTRLSHLDIAITSVADFTTRIYDLTLPPLQKPNNPHWPPAHGLQMSESEGDGIGRCVVVLVGGRSGGHKGAVFCAAFHQSAPLIATCPRREDKPLFSTDLIHKARVLSITWLSHDVLISHSAPALMRGRSLDDISYEEGTVVVWRWLGFDRFFPPGKPYQKVIRGCASVQSFKVISAYHLPLTTFKLHVFTSPTHDPLLLIPMDRIIRVINITHLRPREPPPFPMDKEVVELTSRMQSNKIPEASQTSQRSRLVLLLDAVEGWDVSVAVAQARRPELPPIAACEMAFGGGAVLGIGERGTLFIWRLTSR
ncbi:hypothetical protein B0H21DRAFT_723297 [Amylocystis lapponica]|nr:hypothetical protein B0H21DRAFT_723297 [Amylocystis lapponica]